MDKEKTKKKTNDSNNSKDNALEAAVAQITKQFGVGAIAQKQHSLPGIEFYTTQIPSMDWSLGGGWAKGRIGEIYGPESSGKTTVTLHAIAGVQAGGDKAAFIDAEHALDIDYAKALGVDTDNLVISQPDNGEEALEIVEILTRSGALSLIVVDSVAALVPRAEIEGEMGDSHMGLQARLMSQAMRKLTGIAKKTGTTILFINQTRMKIGLVFGNPITTTGGNALKFYASQRVEVSKKQVVKEGDEVIGTNIRFKCVKNKVAPPFRETEVLIKYGTGLDITTDILRNAVDAGLVDKNGSWYSFQNERLGQGESKTTQFLEQNLEIRDRIEKLLRENL